MKTSSSLIPLACFLGGAEAFSQQRASVVHSNTVVRKCSSMPTGSSRSSRLFQLPLDNPKQELLNNRHSASDWLYNVKSLPQSGVLREIRNPVLSVFGWATFVSLVQRFMMHSKANAIQSLATKMCIPGVAHSFLMSSLGLLLVFRTNSAYQRFNVRDHVYE